MRQPPYLMGLPQLQLAAEDRLLSDEFRMEKEIVNCL
jgi:hypothetical protein